MTDMNNQELQQARRFEQEWLSLQNHYEHYERGSLLIKLVCVVLFAAALVLRFNVIVAAVLVLILWLQEGIFRTCQARMGDRLLQVEASLRESAQTKQTAQAFQLHTEWLKTRPSAVGLIMEYAKNAARPTVAFPYIVLLVLDVSVYLVWH